MAQYAGVTLGLPAVAFDPMPLAGSYIATQLGRSSISLVYPAEYTPIENQLAGYPNITNFIGPRDPVNGIVDHLCGGAVGTVVASNVGKSPIIISNIPSDPRLIRLFPELLINRFFYNHDMNNIVLAMLTVQLAAPQLLGK